MPLFSTQNKNMDKILIITFVFIFYCAVTIDCAIKVDNALEYYYPKMSKKEMRKICVYVFFWFIFFVKLDKIIQGEW